MNEIICPISDLPDWSFTIRHDTDRDEWVCCGYGPHGTPVVARFQDRQVAIDEAVDGAIGVRITGTGNTWNGKQ